MILGTEYKAYAKINLGLDILYRREDGLHEVDMIMASLALHDSLFFKANTSGEITLEMVGFFGNIEDNLIYRAAIKMQQKFDISAGVEIKLIKRIPVAAGLAGGSSDCAVTLNALSIIWGIAASTAEKKALAVELGADVTYCLFHKMARVTGIGEKIRFISTLPKIYVVLFKPKYGISTAEAYQKVSNKKINHIDIDMLEKKLASGSYDEICAAVGNSFEQPTFAEYPDLAYLKQVLKADADVSILSGSGPTIFALTKSIDKRDKLALIGEENGFLAIKTETKR
ncbi:4-diphosphocytidyl-2-C-methyl-D-erythritol kinase [Erysipelotrichaceae bacterium]|nr:4-diphosphocytidyl-2-C-methyl-D-erythritol kinase [Erysipelotrichaceae bacterium]